MTIQRRLMISALCASALLLNGAAVGVGQEKRDVVIERTPVLITAPLQDHDARIPFEMMVGGRRGDTFMFISSEMSIDGKVVKGAPYSAQAITEYTQTLADGNRIVHKNSASVYRDSEGRTRREQTIGAVGPYATDGNRSQTVFINDPVTGFNYILEVDSKTARKIDLSNMPMRRPFGSRRQPGEDRVEVVTGDKSGETVSVHVERHHAKIDDQASKDSVKESLGKQTIEGVLAEGTRTTRTIPAGKIGNEQAINIVSERWYSEELQTLVMSKHSDPRFGESSYRLVNINRTEPAASLFQVPSDYTIKETIEGGEHIRIRRENRRQADRKEL